MLKLLRSVYDWAVTVCFPARCILCRRLVFGTENTVCPACLPKLPETRRSGKECVDAREKHIEFAETVIAPFFYEGALRQALLRYKFGDVWSYASVFAGFAADAVERAVQCGAIAAPELVTYVPVSAKRLRARGYDQARLFAEALARRLDCPILRLLEKTTDTPAQSSLDERVRRANVVGVYEPVPALAAQVSGRHVLLADDVLTTGATLAEAAKTLAYLNPVAITCVTIAQTDRKKAENG